MLPKTNYKTTPNLLKFHSETDYFKKAFKKKEKKGL